MVAGSEEVESLDESAWERIMQDFLECTTESYLFEEPEATSATLKKLTPGMVVQIVQREGFPDERGFCYVNAADQLGYVRVHTCTMRLFVECFPALNISAAEEYGSGLTCEEALRLITEEDKRIDEAYGIENASDEEQAGEAAGSAAASAAGPAAAELPVEETAEEAGDAARPKKRRRRAWGQAGPRNNGKGGSTTQKTLEEIRRLQSGKSAELLIPKLAFGRLCKDVLAELLVERNRFELEQMQQERGLLTGHELFERDDPQCVRFSSDALHALQVVCEWWLVDTFSYANRCAHHGKRVTVMLPDWQLVQELRR